MIKRLIKTILISLLILFLPYYIGIIIHNNTNINLINPNSSIDSWFLGIFTLFILSIIIILIGIIIYRIILPLIDWIKTGK